MFFLIDSILMSFGCSLTLSNRSILYKVINIFLGVWLTLDNIHFVAGRLYKPSHSLTTNLRAISFITGVVTTQVLLILRRRKIGRLLTKLITLTDTTTQQYLKKLSIALIAHYILSLIRGIGFTLSIVTNDNVLERSVRGFFFWSDQVGNGHKILFPVTRLFKGLVRDQWNHIGLTLYVYIAISIEKLAHRRMEMELATNELKDMIDILIIKQKFDSMRGDFEQLFNLLPLIWFSWVFQGSSEVFTIKGNLKTWFFLDLGQNLISLFGAIFFINYHRNRCHQLNQRIFYKFANKWKFNTISNIQLIKTQLISNVEYTALGLFRLDNGLLLSFISGLVTFTVMALQ